MQALQILSYGDLSIEESLNMIHVNIDAVVAMGLVCIPYMKKGQPSY